LAHALKAEFTAADRSELENFMNTLPQDTPTGQAETNKV
jgi:hypothetical protein